MGWKSETGLKSYKQLTESFQVTRQYVHFLPPVAPDRSCQQSMIAIFLQLLEQLPIDFKIMTSAKASLLIVLRYYFDFVLSTLFLL